MIFCCIRLNNINIVIIPSGCFILNRFSYLPIEISIVSLHLIVSTVHNTKKTQFQRKDLINAFMINLRLKNTHFTLIELNYSFSIVLILRISHIRLVPFNFFVWILYQFSESFKKWRANIILSYSHVFMSFTRCMCICERVCGRCVKVWWWKFALEMCQPFSQTFDPSSFKRHQMECVLYSYNTQNHLI